MMMMLLFGSMIEGVGSGALGKVVGNVLERER